MSHDKLIGFYWWKKVQMSDTVCAKGLVKLNVLVRLRWYGKFILYKDTRWEVHMTTNNIAHCS